MSDFDDGNSIGAVAIIGMSGRFPGAQNMEEFWNNLYNGVESVRFFNREELIKMGIDKHLLDNPRFVAADAILDGMDQFDAAFFDYSAREAEITDPQHRLFLESAWEVMESAGYDSEQYDGRVAVFAGANLSGYMIRNLYSNPGLVENVGTFKIMLANGQDFLATKVSYKMNLMGPSVNVNTLCSSSMVALHYACQNLLSYGCDLALAGGVSFQVSRNEAFFYQEGGIGSSDGHCRAFDSKANGTVSGSGLAVVALKRLEDAVEDGDFIHAVIRGTGINNDGASKNSYTAPNADGQAECIAEAIAVSGIDPETISYIDAHGTGTDLGDPIEIAALTKAFRAYTKKKQFCAIGSVKTNIGHLVNAGGLASVVKTVLSLEHGVIPPSLNFEEPNRKIDFENSPFYVNTKLSKWETEGFPRRAGVSSFGIGGTNTHVILEEAPAAKQSEASKRPLQLICLSAKTGQALEKMTSNLISFARKNAGSNLADVAFTLNLGRRNFNHRRFLVCRDMKELAEKLEEMSPESVFSHFRKPKDQPVVFMFPGMGAYTGMGVELYRSEAVFQNIINRCAKIYEAQTGKSLLKVLYPKEANGASAEKEADDVCADTTCADAACMDTACMDDVCADTAALFAVQYALAELFMSWGIEPQCMAGQGAGEYVAACLSGVVSPEDALKLVTARDEILPDLISVIDLNKARIPFISCVSGNWISGSEAVSHEYWLGQRGGTRFLEGLQEVMKDPDRILIEIGPGNNLCIEAEKYEKKETCQPILYSVPCQESNNTGMHTMLGCIGKFWLAGGRVDWKKFYAAEKRRRIPLPTYPFERQRYWIEPGRNAVGDHEPDFYITGREGISKELLEDTYKEGIITLKLDLSDLDNKNGNEELKERLEEILVLKERMKELSREYGSIRSKIEISALGLTSGATGGLSPSNVNEKLKKRPRPELESTYVAPGNDVERAIIEKWQDVLGFDTIGIYDDFFELGGHSLIAAAVATELSKRFDVQIPMRTLFETTTARGIAELIETYKWASEGIRESAASEELEDGAI